MKNLILKSAKTLALGIPILLLNNCGPGDTYQGNGIWSKSDGSTYRGAAPLRVTSVQLDGNPFVRERVNVVENKSTNNQGQIVIREKEAVIVEMDFLVTVTLENGEQHQLSYSVSGNQNSNQYVNRSFTGSNGYRYSTTGTVLLSQFNPSFNININSKGIANWQDTIRLR